MEFCKSGATTSYKPVAIFTNGVLQPDTAGVFTGCLLPSDNGFKVVLTQVSKKCKNNHVKRHFFLVKELLETVDMIQLKQIVTVNLMLQ